MLSMPLTAFLLPGPMVILVLCAVASAVFAAKGHPVSPPSAQDVAAPRESPE
jgi:hypothetical protein